MLTNELLEEKWKTQANMAKQAGYDIKILLDNADKIAGYVFKNSGKKQKIAKIKPYYGHLHKKYKTSQNSLNLSVSEPKDSDE